MPSTWPVEVSVAKSFDYSSLDAETSRFVQRQTGEILTLMKRTAQDILEIGQKLIEVKTKLKHGQFGAWLKAEFNWTERTAQRFMRVAEQFSGKTDNLSELSLAPSALYLLAAPSTPEKAREEAVARAKAGERVTYATAKQIKQKYSSSSAKPTKSAVQTQREKDLPEASLQKRQRSQYNSSPDEITVPSQKQKRLSIVLEEKLPNPSSSQSEFVQSESLWRLGNHLLYCGMPNSPQFQAQLPDYIALVLSFAPITDWIDSLSSKVNSSVTLFSHYRDLDLKLLRELVQNSLELYTNGGETVVFSFLRDPALLLLGHYLDCRCLIAEPSTKCCQEAIWAWRQTGGQVEVFSR